MNALFDQVNQAYVGTPHGYGWHWPDLNYVTEQPCSDHTMVHFVTKHLENDMHAFGGRMEVLMADFTTSIYRDNVCRRILVLLEGDKIAVRTSLQFPPPLGEDRECLARRCADALYLPAGQLALCTTSYDSNLQPAKPARVLIIELTDGVQDPREHPGQLDFVQRQDQSRASWLPDGRGNRVKDLLGPLIRPIGVTVEIVEANNALPQNERPPLHYRQHSGEMIYILEGKGCHYDYRNDHPGVYCPSQHNLDLKPGDMHSWHEGVPSTVLGTNMLYLRIRDNYVTGDEHLFDGQDRETNVSRPS